MEYVNHYTWIVVRALVIKDFLSFLLAYSLGISPHLASIRLLFIISWIWQRFLIRLILVSSFIFITVSTIPIPFKFPLWKNSCLLTLTCFVLFYFINNSSEATSWVQASLALKLRYLPPAIYTNIYNQGKEKVTIAWWQDRM